MAGGRLTKLGVSVLFTAVFLSAALAPAQGTVGRIVFAEGEEDVEPINPTDLFSEGAPIVYAFFDFKHLKAADILSGVWYLNDEVVLAQATTIGQIFGAVAEVPEGKLYFSIQFDDGAEPGRYRLELSVNSAVVQTGEFVVEALAVGVEGERDEGGRAVSDRPTGEALPAVEHLLFEDDFEDPASGWGTASSENGSVAYDAGRLVITLEGRNQPAVSVHQGIFADAVIEVEAATLAGPEDNALGIVARYQDNDNYYAFLVSADGYHAILHFVDGSTVWDQQWELDTTGGIELGTAANDLLVQADGPTLRFYVNGRLRGEIRDALWAEGQVGVFAGVFDEPGVQVGFDRWRVWSLPPGE